MKEILYLALLSLAGLVCPAQQKVFELPLDSADADGLKVYHAFDLPNARIHLTFASHFKVQRFMLSCTDSTAGSPTMMNDPQVYDRSSLAASILPFDYYLGYSMLRAGTEEVFSDKAFSRIVFINSPFNSHPVQRTDSILTSAGEHIFAYFHQLNDFYALSYLKGGDSIRIYHHRSGGNTEIISKEIPVKDWGRIGHRQSMLQKKKVRDLSDLIDGLGLIVKDPYTPPPLLACLSRTKLFVAPGKVYLSFDNTDLDTYVAEIPLDRSAGRIMHFDALPYYHKAAPPGFSNGNSFIIDSTLIVASIIHLQVYLAFYDLSSGTLKAAYEPGADGRLSFSHSPFWQVGDLWKKSAVHEIRREVFAKNSFDFWTLGISAYKYGDGRIQLEAGTAYNRETFGKMMLALATMGAYSGMGAAAGMPGSAWYAATGNGRMNTMFFSAQFRDGAYSSLPYKELVDKSELINNFVDSRKIDPKGVSLSNFQGTYWLGFYNPVDQKYLIYKF